MKIFSSTLALSALVLCTRTAQPQSTPAPHVMTPPPTPTTMPTFQRLRYTAVYNGMPYQSLDLTILGNGHGTLAFAGNTASPLFPHVGRMSVERQIPPPQLTELVVALAAVHLDTIPNAPGAMPVATQHVWITTGATTVEREFPLYEAPTAWRPAATALQHIVGNLLAPVNNSAL